MLRKVLIASALTAAACDPSGTGGPLVADATGVAESSEGSDPSGGLALAAPGQAQHASADDTLGSCFWARETATAAAVTATCPEHTHVISGGCRSHAGYVAVSHPVRGGGADGSGAGVPWYQQEAPSGWTCGAAKEAPNNGPLDPIPEGRMTATALCCGTASPDGSESEGEGGGAEAGAEAGGAEAGAEAGGAEAGGAEAGGAEGGGAEGGGAEGGGAEGGGAEGGGAEGGGAEGGGGPDPVGTPGPGLDPTVPADFCEMVRFIYEGDSPPQAGVGPGTIECAQASLLFGVVRDESGEPLQGASVSIVGAPEYGFTLTNELGQYDLVVNGGKRYVAKIEYGERLPAQREVLSELNEGHRLADAVLVTPDPAVTPIEFGSPQTQVHLATPVIDMDGARTAALIFLPNTTATLVFDDGSTEQPDLLSIRATEYTVGEDGLARMPAKIAENTAYTYAAAFVADEAIAAGAASIEFDRPAIMYLDNFLNDPVGTIVPAGSYEPDSGQWTADPDGLAVGILGFDAAGAILDVNGSGLPATQDQLDELGITDEELLELASLPYGAGDSVWRTPMYHFTDIDLNHQGFPIDGAEAPPDDVVNGNGDTDCANEANGSIIECENQVLGQRLPVVGTPFTLNYRSSRVSGSPKFKLHMNITGDELPPNISAIGASVQIAGHQVDAKNFEPMPNLEWQAEWNGLDGFGRALQGPQPARVCLIYYYPVMVQAVGRGPSDGGGGGGGGGEPQAAERPAGQFGQEAFLNGELVSGGGRGLTGAGVAKCYGEDGVTSGLNNLGTLNRSNMIRLGTLQARDASDRLGGWTLDIHHTLSRESAILYRGDGTERDLRRRAIPLAIRFAGNGDTVGSFSGLPATGTVFATLRSLAAAPDGSVFIATPGAVRRVRPDGIVERFVGDGTPGNFDNADALNGQISERPVAMDVAPDGDLYIADQDNALIRRVRDGALETFAGAGTGIGGCSTIDQGMDQRGRIPLDEINLVGITDLAIDPSSQTIYWIQSCGATGTQRIRSVRYGSDKAEHVAGSPYPSVLDRDLRPDDWSSGNDGEGFHPLFALLSQPHSLALTDGGNLLVAEGGGSTGADERRIRDLGTRNAATTYPMPARLFSVGTRIPNGLAYRNGKEVYSSNDGPAVYSRDRRLLGGGNVVMDPGQDMIEVPARNLHLESVGDIDVGPDNTLYVLDYEQNMVFALTRRPPEKYRGSVVPSADGGELYQFDRYGRHLETRNGHTGETKWSFNYTERGYLSAVVDAYGRRMEIERDAEGVAQAIVAPDGLRTELGHDNNGYLNAITNPNGETTRPGYDEQGRMVSYEMPQSPEHLHTFEYSYEGYLIRDSTPRGAQTLERIEDTGDRIEVVRTTAAGDAVHYMVEIDGKDQSTRTVIAPDNTSEVTERDGMVTRRIFADGTTLVAEQTRDERLGQNVRYVKEATFTTPSGRSSVGTSVRSHVPGCEIYPEDCPENGRWVPDVLTTTSTVDGREWLVEYHRAHGTTPAVVNYQSPEGRTSRTILGPQGRVEVLEDNSFADTVIDYDEVGRVDTVSQSDGVTTRSVTVTYDAQGFPDSVTDSLGRTTTYEYDGAGRTRFKRRSGRATETRYDAGGNVTAVVPPSKPEHGFQYDVSDLLEQYSPPAIAQGQETGPPVAYEYDDAGTLELLTTSDGQTVDPVFDEATGRLDRLVVPRGEYAFSYDNAGRVSSVTNPDGVTLGYQFDGGLTLRETMTGSVSGSVQWHYDDQMEFTGESIGSGSLVEVEYDDDDLLTRVGDLTLTRHPQDGWVQSTQLGATTLQVEPNGFGDVAALVYEHGDNELYSVSYTHDGIGRIKSKTESIGAQTRTRCYEFDELDRLEEVYSGVTAGGACTGSLLEEYDYDDNGNRTYARNSSGTLNTFVMTHDGQDRMLRYGDLSFEYGDNGDLSRKENTATGEVWNYDFDVEGQLRSVTLPDGRVIAYVYDGRGRRVGRSVDGVLGRRLLYGDDLNPIAQLDASGAVETRFVYGLRGNVPDYMVRDGRTYRILSDYLGSVIAVVDVETAEIVQELEYDSWGRVLADSNPGFQPFGFAGGIWDSELGLVQFGARDYDPEIGRWILPDPIGFGAGDTNLYGYVWQDPVNFLDMTGYAAASGLSTGQRLFDLADAALKHGANFAAGYGDNQAFNATVGIRDGLGLSEYVDRCSFAYMLGDAIATIQGFARGKLPKVRRFCFGEGTLVETEDGLVPIEEVEVGDMVWSRDDETFEEGWKPVVELFVAPDKELLELTFEGEDGDAQTLRVTAEHPLWSLDDGDWEEAGDLELGERIDTLHGPAWLVSAAQEPGLATVYNFEVADSHTYFVGKPGFWAHNTCFPKAQELQRVFKTTKQGWHKTVKPQILKETSSFARRIGAKNPDIGVNKAGNIVLRNPQTGRTIVTDALADWFLP